MKPSCVCVCMCVYIHIHTHRERETERDRERDREREIAISKPHCNHKPNIYNRYTHKKEKGIHISH